MQRLWIHSYTTKYDRNANLKNRESNNDKHVSSERLESSFLLNTELKFNCNFKPDMTWGTNERTFL